MVRKAKAGIAIALLVPLCLTSMGACEEAPAADGACAAYLDDELEAVRVVIENRRTTPVYFTNFDPCMMTVGLAIEDEAGVPYEAQRDACGGTCAMLVNGFGCGGGGCDGGGLGLLLPGFSSEVVWEPWQLELSEVPQQCKADGLESAGGECTRQTAAPAGRYTLTLSAALSARCGPEDNDKPCVCSPSGGATTCAIFDEYRVEQEVTFTATIELPDEDAQEVRLVIE